MKEPANTRRLVLPAIGVTSDTNTAAAATTLAEILTPFLAAFVVRQAYHSPVNYQ